MSSFKLPGVDSALQASRNLVSGASAALNTASVSVAASPIGRTLRTTNALLDNPIIGGLFTKLVDPVTRGRITSALTEVSGLGNSITDRGIYTAISARPDPQLTFHWSVVMPWGFTPSYVEDVDLTFPRTDSEGLHFNNTKKYYPGFTDIDAVNITFYEDNYASTLNYLTSWSRKVVDAGGFYGRPADFKATIAVTLHDSLLRPGVVFFYEGAWPTRINNVTLLSDANDRVRLQAEFSVDNCSIRFVDPVKLAQVGGNGGPVDDVLSVLSDIDEISRDGVAVVRQFSGILSRAGFPSIRL